MSRRLSKAFGLRDLFARLNGLATPPLLQRYADAIARPRLMLFAHQPRAGDRRAELEALLDPMTDERLFTDDEVDALVRSLG